MILTFRRPRSATPSPAPRHDAPESAPRGPGVARGLLRTAEGCGDTAAARRAAGTMVGALLMLSSWLACLRHGMEVPGCLLRDRRQHTSSAGRRCQLRLHHELGPPLEPSSKLPPIPPSKAGGRSRSSSDAAPCGRGAVSPGGKSPSDIHGWPSELLLSPKRAGVRRASLASRRNEYIHEVLPSPRGC